MKNEFFLCPVLSLLILSCSGNSSKNENTMTKHTENSTSFKSDYSVVNGLKMYYEIHGEGSPLVLIHGGGSTIQTTFGHVIPDLAMHFRVIAVELQAHGHSGDRNAAESFEQDADDVAQLVKNLNISKASFFGFSNGGNTAMQIAVRHPEIVDKLIIASAFFKRDGLLPGFFDTMKNASLENMPVTLKTAYLKINPDSSMLQNMFNKDKERMLNFKDWPDATLQSIHAPSLIIGGDHDVVQAGHVLAMSKLIANSRLLILPATHGSYLGAAETGKPDMNLMGLTLGIIEEFLNKAEASVR